VTSPVKSRADLFLRPKDLHTGKDIRGAVAKAQRSSDPGPRPIAGKAIGIIGLPDTVNEARVRSIVSKNLTLEKVEMKPENEGAILVFQREAVLLVMSNCI
jgi:hypothetical protein